MTFGNPAVLRPQLGASPKFCLFRLSYCREMTPQDIDEKTADFVRAAITA
jgi:hypothetical protein